MSVEEVVVVVHNARRLEARRICLCTCRCSITVGLNDNPNEILNEVTDDIECIDRLVKIDGIPTTLLVLPIYLVRCTFSQTTIEAYSGTR